jgi:type II secretory pathway component GspD/PulD (secretin)
MSSRLLPIWLTALALAVLAGAPARAQTEAYCNITAVTTTQLNNAVRIKLDADGTLAVNINQWWRGASGNYYLDWALAMKQTTMSWAPECYPQVNRILVHIDNALSQVGSVVNVGRYPVSLVRLVMAPEGNKRYGLDLEVVLHKRMRIRWYSFGQDLMGWDAYLLDHRDPAWFEMVLSPDRRSLIITVASDRLPDVRERRRLSDVPEQDRELRVNYGDGKLTVHARNAALSEVAEAVSRGSGTQLAAGEGAADRLVTAEVPSIAPEEFAARLADCYGLVLAQMPGRIVLSDAVGQTAASQSAIEQTTVPVRNLKAAAAADLLPSFLLDYVRIDEQSNALLVSGPKPLADKVAVDVAKIDRAATGISVRARVIESSSSEELTRQLALQYGNAGRQSVTDAEAGQITYSTSDALPDDFEVRLRALTTTGQAKVRADSSVVVPSGGSGEIFSGQDKYVLLFRRLYDATPSVEPVNAGVKVTVTAWAGDRAVSMNVATEVKSIDAIDPVTRMPTVSTRSVRGAFRLRPGETAVIGGLTQTQEYWARRKLPILGDLPLVGGLFRSKRRQQSTSELLVLLTPTLVEAKSAADGPRAGMPAADTMPPRVPPQREGRTW